MRPTLHPSFLSTIALSYYSLLRQLFSHTHLLPLFLKLPQEFVHGLFELVQFKLLPCAISSRVIGAITTIAVSIFLLHLCG